MCNVHFNREVDSERPKSQGSEKSNDVVEEREEHRDECRDHHEDCPPNQPKEVEFEGAKAWDWDIDVFVDELAIWESVRCEFLDEGEEGLAKNLVSTDEMDYDGYVRYVEKPIRIVEAETGEEVARSKVSKGCISHTPTK